MTKLIHSTQCRLWTKPTFPFVVRMVLNADSGSLDQLASKATHSNLKENLIAFNYVTTWTATALGRFLQGGCHCFLSQTSAGIANRITIIFIKPHTFLNRLHLLWVTRFPAQENMLALQ